tara:strand:+ start:322 stop:630 length:309 start_codon:yes stop_codon:yes gene_type:complete
MKTEKNTITQVHAAPKTQPAGVHGAFFKSKYQLDVGPSFMSKVPKNRAPKFIAKKPKKVSVNFIYALILSISFKTSCAWAYLLSLAARSVDDKSCHSDINVL